MTAGTLLPVRYPVPGVISGLRSLEAEATMERVQEVAGAIRALRSVRRRPLWASAGGHPGRSRGSYMVVTW
jgi:hypothetical protein